MPFDQVKFLKARAIFHQYGGILRASQAIRYGVHPRTLYEMRDSGLLDQLGRGLYRLSELPVLGDPDLSTVALKIPRGVICLLSALAFHEITAHIPHEIYLAVIRGTTRPRLDYPHLRIFWFTNRSFGEGIEIYTQDDIPIRVYNPEKTLADCFKYRNKIGIDTAIEALKLYRQRKSVNIEELLRFARICRVLMIMKPYLEALL